MTQQTKHYLIIGGGLVVAVALAVILYKRYEASSTASQAATDQSNQDALAYLEASSTNSPYGYAGGGGSTVSLAPAGTQQTLAQQVAAIEQEFGFGPPAAPAPTPASTPTSGSPAGPSAPTPSKSPAPVPPARQKYALDSAQPEMTMEHEAFV
ncbi:MAG TPA: hypothetical protein VN785_12245 [Candidatus Angelobacter sp.]|nr:hypothetical protein [Candidatus Angelobacter sp.]